MKQLKNIFRTLFLLLAILGGISSPAFAEDNQSLGNIEIGLITCSPHEEIYSLYGHTALRYHDLNTGQDLVFNYGVFNFDQPFFVLRFVFGLTDYELGILPYRFFCQYYEEWGSQVTEHVLQLSDNEKMAIAEALAINYRPENRTYRYNFFYDNCSTRPRDIIEKNIHGKINYASRQNTDKSFRELIHEYNKHHPWAAFGNDLLLGVKADNTASQRQQEFLPLYLMEDFDNATVDRNGNISNLVKERRVLVPHGVQTIESDFPLTPTQCAVLLLIITVLITCYDWKRKRLSVWYDVILMATTGLLGCVLFIMIFSQHPTTSINLQILLLNPCSLIFIPQIIRKKKTIWFHINLICILLFFIGGIWQDYAEGMELVALSLLLRIWKHYNEK